uniref:Sulphate transporter n=1 Tax=Riptortus pedestris TaxID=329032 RepID=R4WQ78_RIPPE|nr:sulphate transporter [Riptortus pedestris]
MVKENAEYSRKKSSLDKVSKYIPAVRWLRSYTKEDAISDCIAGITLGLTMIPQSIAYAALAGLTPQDGLNSAFVGCFIYSFFGTIKEVVIGPTSLMALLTYEYTHHLSSDFVILLCFLCGVVELIMGALNLGFLVELISAPVVSGFTTATSLIIVVSQMKSLLGLKFSSEGILDNIIKLCQNVKKVRTGDTLLGLTCIICLLLLRKLKDVNIPDKFPYRSVIKKTLWFISTGRNALIVVLSALVAFYYKEKGGAVPFYTTRTADTSIPSIRLPPMSTTFNNRTYTFPEMVSSLGTGYLVIPIISVLANVAIAKAFVNGAVEASHEMVTLSLCNMAGSLVQSMPTTGAFTRSAVASASGVRTPLAGLYAAALTFMALGFLGSYFHYIPKATLAAVLIAAVIFLVDWEIVKQLWKKSWLDLFTVGCTLIACITLGVELGLLLGVVVGLINLVYRWARPEILVENQKSYSGNVVMVTPMTGFYFPAVDFVSSAVQKAGLTKGRGKATVYVDCSRFSGTDYTVAKGINSLVAAFEKRGQKLQFINVPANCYALWTGTGCKEVYFKRTEDSTNIFDDSGKALQILEEDNDKEPEQKSLLSKEDCQV